jgi:hypothetical protein
MVDKLAHLQYTYTAVTGRDVVLLCGCERLGQLNNMRATTTHAFQSFLALPPRKRKKPPSPSLLTQDARCSYLSYRKEVKEHGRPAATVPLSPNRILSSSTETGNHTAAASPPEQGRGKRERSGKASVRMQAKPGTATSSRRGMRRGSVPGHVHVHCHRHCRLAVAPWRAHSRGV